MKTIALDKRAYRGAPKPPTKSILAKLEDDRPPKIKPEIHWSHKPKWLRRQEKLETL